jgi:hypothetical protein
MNILGSPLGSPACIESYLRGKGLKHTQLLDFIKSVAEAGYPREATAMLTGAAFPRLSHILKSIQKNSAQSLRSKRWIQPTYRPGFIVSQHPGT